MLDLAHMIHRLSETAELTFIENKQSKSFLELKQQEQLLRLISSSADQNFLYVFDMSIGGANDKCNLLEVLFIYDVLFQFASHSMIDVDNILGGKNHG